MDPVRCTTPGSARPKNAAASFVTADTAAMSTPVATPMRWKRWARSSVHTLPAATAVNGQPPRPPKADSNEVTPARNAAYALARPRP